MKALMLGACLAAVATAIWGGAPALAQPGDQGGYPPDPYYDQPPPLSQAPASPPQPQPAPPSGPPAEGAYQSDRGYGQYRPPPPPPAGQPGFQVYQGGQAAGAYAPPARTYAPADRDYDTGRAYRVYSVRPDRWSDPYRAAPAWRYTGRVGGTWRNPEGQYCVWRQRTWTAPNGRSLYQWVPNCDGD